MTSSLHHLRPAGRWSIGAGLLCGLCGCVGFWEEVTSRERDMSYVFSKPDPLVTLRDSTDNHRKAEALMRLQEPLQSGGNQQQQDLYLNILARAAVNEQPGHYEPMSRDPLCRLAALRMLGQYKDARALPILEKAYFDPQPFTADMNAMIRQQALASLKDNGNPQVRLVLIRAARQPNAAPVSSPTERQQVLDERLAAVKALGNYPQYDSVETLVHILETEKDVALRDSAHESLRAATKRDLPNDARLWRELLVRGNVQAPPEPNLIQRVVGWTTANQ